MTPYTTVEALEAQMRAAGVDIAYTPVEEVAERVVAGILADEFWIHPAERSRRRATAGSHRLDAPSHQSLVPPGRSRLSDSRTMDMNHERSVRDRLRRQPRRAADRGIPRVPVEQKFHPAVRRVPRASARRRSRP